MANANDTQADPDLEDDLDEDEEDDDKSDKGDKGKDGDGKPKREPETPEARKARLERELARHQKKHPDLYKDKKDEKPEAKPSDGKEPKLDYGQLAFLSANDIKADDEQALAQQIATETGKELKDVIKGAYFQAELKSLREENAAKDAEPGAKRSKASSPSSVEYWLEKGGLPIATADNRKLRTDIVNARIARNKAGSQFTDNPVAGRS